MERALVPRFKRSVIPIFQEKNHAMESGGTGTLFEIGGEFFLITAEHVFKAHDAGLGLYVPRTSGQLVQLEGNVLREKALDIAAFRLSDLTAAALNGHTFLTPADALLKREPLKDGLFFVYGFPKVFSFPSVVEAKIRAGEVNIVSQKLTKNPPVVLDPEVFLLLDAYANEWDLNGISGCSIWQAFRTGDSWETWDSASAQVIAVETGTYREHTVVEGTRVRHVFRMIAQRMDHLKPYIMPHL
jgi:hypothetical protein